MTDEPVTDEVPQEQAPETSEAPPWGDDFDAERAWKTITSQREREKELEPDAKAFKRLRDGEDPDTFKEIMEAYGYQIPEDDDDSYEDDEEDFVDPVVKEIEDLKQFKQSLEMERQIQAFNDEVERLAEAEGFKPEDLDDMDRLLIAQSANTGRNFDIKKGFEAFLDYEKAKEQKAIERYKKSLEAPSSPVSGESASEVPDLSTRADMVRHIQSKIGDRGL